jgi:hypothetical protein
MAVGRESAEAALKRWKDLELLQAEYKDFRILLVDIMEGVLGFKCSPLQLDIGEWIDHGPQYRMVQAQRGQAKTTISAIKAIHYLIHNPAGRVLIVSSGEDMASEISSLIIQIMMAMPELECMRPDRSNGDRSSIEAFDVHYSLKGVEKSPSIRCMGITANMQGKRADLLIADDVESSKNSQTAVQRERIKHLTLDFSSINSKGEILWLGTPQSIDSIYNGLPGRGVSIRIWPGRYPTEAEMESYEGFLAPFITNAMHKDPTLRIGGGIDGLRGQATDPVIVNEANLQAKELDQGAAYFQLQHMLCTALSDQDRFPLKLSLIRFCAFDTEERIAPMVMSHIRSEQYEVKWPQDFNLKSKAYQIATAEEMAKIPYLSMYIDPAGGGQNGDEVAYAVGGMLAGRIIVCDVGGRKGGTDETTLEWMTDIVKKWKPRSIKIEKNFGNGAFYNVWKPTLHREYKEPVGIEEVWESGQKELRICDILEPVIGAGKLVISMDLLKNDWDRVQVYPMEFRQTYSLFWQMARITRDKGALIHDDKVDALAGFVRIFAEHLHADDAKARAAARNAAYKALMSNPLGNGRKLPGTFGKPIKVANALGKHGLSGTGHIKPGRRIGIGRL